MDRIHVALVEDNLSFREDLAMLLTDAPAIKAVDQYTDAKTAMKGIGATPPDVALIDLGLPDFSGTEVIRDIVKRDGKTECLVLTAYDDDTHLFAALGAGAVGYIVKDQTSQAEVVQAIQEVRSGGAPMSLGIARRVLSAFSKATIHAGPAIQGLTPREIEILEYRVKGFTTRGVADAFGISYETVRRHQKTIYEKLHVHSMGEAVAVFRGEKVI